MDSSCEGDSLELAEEQTAGTFNRLIRAVKATALSLLKNRLQEHSIGCHTAMDSSCEGDSLELVEEQTAGTFNRLSYGHGFEL